MGGGDGSGSDIVRGGKGWGRIVWRGRGDGGIGGGRWRVGGRWRGRV